ncbi:MAG: precorrin-3B C(17)-methyltransferase [Bacillota bacterium]|nr:precorrin-3B C(17)-methyltransferase [Bacillota bacterium]
MRAERGTSHGKLLIVGFGPGSRAHMTERARQAIEESEVVIGYNTYVDLVRDMLADQKIIRTGMTEEVSRARAAVREAKAGKTVAVISSGDAGVYGMAGLIFEVLVAEGWRPGENPDVEVIPGISAAQSCASLLGAPLMHDFVCISLSDHLTPWSLIARRVELAAQGDFVIVLYNPKSGRRTRQIVETQRILLRYRRPDTPVGLVKSAYRQRQRVAITTLENLLDEDIGMLTTVIIGNSTTFVHAGLMITPRGYQRKYTLSRDEQPLALHERLRPEAEPWSLEARIGGERDATGGGTREAAAATVPNGSAATVALSPGAFTTASDEPRTVLEMAVSPGVANKRFRPHQLLLLAELAGERGELVYTPDHCIVLRLADVPDGEAVRRRLEAAGLRVLPVGNVVRVKACDFCDGKRADSIPYAEALARRLEGLPVEKELKIGFNGCGMACYGAIQEDIGIVYRRGAFDLFLGGKTVGRTAHPAQKVAEGIPPEELVDLVARIVEAYRTHAHPGERFHKFFKRRGAAGFRWQSDVGTAQAEAPVCGE